MAQTLEACRIGLVEPVEGGGDLAMKGLVLARSLVNTEGETLAVRVLNPGRQKCVLRCGVTAGRLIPVDEEDIEESQQEAEERASKEVHVPGHLQDLWKRSVDGLEPRYHYAVAGLLTDFLDVFSKGDHDLGRTNWVKHTIDTSNTRPIRERPRRQARVIKRRLTDRWVTYWEEASLSHPTVRGPPT